MSLLQAIILGIVQGLTEFLPISSSGHLVLVGELMNLEMSALYASAVHVGTLFSVVIYFWKDLWRLLKSLGEKPMTRDHWLIVYLAVGTLPAVILGLSFKEFFERAFKDEILTAIMLCVTGVILLIPHWFRKIRPGEGREVRLNSGLAMGVGQAFAILPGISRSGATIAVGMIWGVKPTRAAEFSFLLAIPAIAGGAILEFSGFEKLGPGVLLNCVVGAVVAFISGLAAVYSVLASIRRGRFQYFAFYCLLVGVASIVYFGFLKSP